jgi:hypothetical protein
MPAPSNAVIVAADVYDHLIQIPNLAGYVRDALEGAERRTHGRNGLTPYVPVATAKVAGRLAGICRDEAEVVADPRLAALLRSAASRFTDRAELLRRQEQSAKDFPSPEPRTVATAGGPQTVKATAEDILALQRQGWSVAAIAKHYGLSRQAVYQRLGGAR